MTFIIDLHTQYAQLVPPSSQEMETAMDVEKGTEEQKDETKTKTQSAPVGSGIDSVPSHPLYSADIEAVRKKFRTDVQHACTVQYRKNFAAYLKSLPASIAPHEDETRPAVSKEMALLCLHMIDEHEKTDVSGMRSIESWNNARTKSIVMLLELLWSNKVDQGFFCHALSSPAASSFSSRQKIKHQVRVTMQILSASCEFAAQHNGMTDRLVAHLFIPFIETLPNAIATMSLPSFKYDSALSAQDGRSGSGSGSGSGNTGDENNKMDTADAMVDDAKDEAAEKQFIRDARRDMHSSSSSSTRSEPRLVVDMATHQEQGQEQEQEQGQEQGQEGQQGSPDMSPAIVLVHIERCVLTLILGREEGEGGDEESSEAALQLIRR